MRRAHVVKLSLGLAAAGAAVLMLDPRSGAERRARILDALQHTSADVSRRIGQTIRSRRGPARGLLHSLASCALWSPPAVPPDADAFLAQRVRTVFGREHMSLGALNIDADEGTVRIRGTVPDEPAAREIVEKAATVPGARAVVSLMRTPDGRFVGGRAGDASVLEARPRAAIHGEKLRQALTTRWPSLTDLDIVASEGHIGHLALLICARSGEPEEQVRTELDAIVQSSI